MAGAEYVEPAEERPPTPLFRIVRSPLRWRLFTPFVALAERAALTNPMTGHAPVRIERGQVVRLDRLRIHTEGAKQA